MSDKQAKVLWAIADLAKTHGISVRQVYLLLQAGALEGVRIGRRTLVTEVSRAQWMAAAPKFESGAARPVAKRPIAKSLKPRAKGDPLYGVLDEDWDRDDYDA